MRGSLVRAGVALLVAIGLAGAVEATASAARAPLPPVIFTQLPVGSVAESAPPAGGGMLRADYGEGARIVLLAPDGQIKVLTAGFHSASDPSLSFDGERIVFAGQREAGDGWGIYEMSVDGSGVRLITAGPGHCRRPFYMSTLYTLTPTDTEPWEQIGFVGSDLVELNEYGDVPASSLYSCKLDGSALRRLTHNLSSEMDPFLMPDGQIVFAGWQRSQLHRGNLGRVALFAINLDGTDYSIFAGDEGRRIKHMPCVTSGRLAVFVEADSLSWDGAGLLASVNLRRNLHSHRSLTAPEDGLFHSPSPLPDGTILVSRRAADGTGTHGVYRVDPAAERVTPEPVHDDAGYHDIQAQALVTRARPDGRSSVVNESDPDGTLYGLNVYTNDLADPQWLKAGTVKRLRVLEGLPRRLGDGVAKLPELNGLAGPGSSANGIPAAVPRRMLGEAPVHEDGSFHVEVPANTPIELQILDEDGLALRRCSWIWAKSHEPRGCIGCHEDPELAPRNRFVTALRLPAVELTLPPERRRTVDFRRDIMPIIEARCVSCHGEGQAPPRLDGGLALVEREGGMSYFNRAYESLLAAEKPSGSVAEGQGRYVDPARARTSRLIWHLFGRNTSRPWDGAIADLPAHPIPEPGGALTDLDRRVFVEWIDLGALWNGIPNPDGLPGRHDGGNR